MQFSLLCAVQFGVFRSVQCGVCSVQYNLCAGIRRLSGALDTAVAQGQGELVT